MVAVDEVVDVLHHIAGGDVGSTNRKRALGGTDVDHDPVHVYLRDVVPTAQTITGTLIGRGARRRNLVIDEVTRARTGNDASGDDVTGAALDEPHADRLGIPGGMEHHVGVAGSPEARTGNEQIIVQEVVHDIGSGAALGIDDEIAVLF